MPVWVKKVNWITLLLAAAVIVQAYIVLADYVRPLAWSFRAFGLVTSLERSEIMYMGADEAKYLRFLEEVIPEDAPVVTPGDGSGFSSQSVMQFYLLPRTIHSQCSEGPITEDCLRVLTNPASFVLAVGDFPPLQEIPGKVFIPYPDANANLRGIYAPAVLATGIQPDAGTYSLTRGIPVAAPFIDLGLLLAFFLLGSLYIVLILKDPSWLEILSMGLPIGMAILSWSIFITSYFGIPISLTSAGIDFGLLAAAPIALHYLLRKSLPRFPAIQWKGLSPARLFRQGWADGLLGLFAFLWLGLSGLISIGRSYTIFDDIANWSLKGYAMAQQGTIQAGKFWGGHILAYPLNIQLSIAVFWLADGDSLPGSKALFPLLGLSLLLGCYRFWRKRGMDHRLSTLGSLLIATVTLFFVHSTYGMSDLPFAAYLVLGTLRSMDALEERRPGQFLLAGLLFAGAAWTRPEGIGYCAALIAAFLLAQWLRKARIGWRGILAYTAPLCFPLIWFALVGARNMQADQIGITINSSWGGILARDYNVPAIWSILKFSWGYVLNWRNFGLAVPLSILLLLGSLPFTHWFRDRDTVILGALTLIAAIIPAFLFFTESFVIPDFPALLSRSFARACLPAGILLVVTALTAVMPAIEKTRHERP